jgi:hypothetical protein
MVTRLSGGLTPADGADPRTFPAIWNATAVSIEATEADVDSLQLGVNANGTAITALQGSAVALGSAVTVLEGSAVALGSAVDVIEAWDLGDLNDVTIGTAVADAQVLAYSTAVSGWVNADAAGGGGGLVHLNTTSFSAVSSQSINNVFSASYRNYKIIVQGSHSSGSAVAINMRMRVGGADNTGANYFYSYNTVDASSVETNVGAGSQSLWIVGFWGDGSGMLDITLTNPNTAARFNFASLFAAAGSTFGLTGRNAGTFNTATAFDGFSLIPASGTFTGTVSVYGFED